MNEEIAKKQQDFCDISDYRDEIEKRLEIEVDPVEIKKINQTLAQIDNTMEVMDLEIKQDLAHQSMEKIFDPIGSFERYAEEHRKYTGGPPDKEDIYEIWDDIQRLKIDDEVDETALLPTEPINSWDS